ncbi:unnamed protein product [Parascedosporium putredinis]|uniref:N-acetyltransferase domain-containing protein n=1 Tax=Parascedosporium putredinis TaxID=1442378 RepID=A0A9P1GWM2_9PEZI|nr:unnamed protein product [Parascedosporium putredinis]CAI7988340.1 unnamed protein product [Parascedosporium putredinis]
MAASDLRIELADSAEDIERGFHCACETFGRQTADGIWIAMNPGWDTPAGYERGVKGMTERWRGVANDLDGNPTIAFVKATLPDPERDGARVAVGMAIWVQASVVEGRGLPPIEDFSLATDLNALYPDNPAEQTPGIASKLVQWGLDEAKRRGGLEAITEASSMGRHVYNRLGFQQEGPEIEYIVDEQFKDRQRPSNIFMRTGLLR